MGTVVSKDIANSRQTSNRRSNMKFSRKIAIGAAAALGLAAGAVIAHPGQMGGMQHGQMGGMQHGQMGGMGHGPKSGMGAHQSMTPEERQKRHESRRAEMHRHAPEGVAAPSAPADSESSK
jgi:Spy/CpxP family protein refolding chaperone